MYYDLLMPRRFDRIDDYEWYYGRPYPQLKRGPSKQEIFDTLHDEFPQFDAAFIEEKMYELPKCSSLDGYCDAFRAWYFEWSGGEEL